MRAAAPRPVADANGSAVVTVTVFDNGGTAKRRQHVPAHLHGQRDRPANARGRRDSDQVTGDNQLFGYPVSVTDADGETSFS
jgi:hypothetical protein